MMDFWQSAETIYVLAGVAAVLVLGGMAYEAWKDWN